MSPSALLTRDLDVDFELLRQITSAALIGVLRSAVWPKGPGIASFPSLQYLLRSADPEPIQCGLVPGGCGSAMDAKALLDAGKLSAAVEQLIQDVRTHPVDSRLRTFLFELLCFAGDYQRAERQLDVIAQQNAGVEVGALTYRNVLAAERARIAVAKDDSLPTFLLEPPPFAKLHVTALHRLREGKPAEARVLLMQAEKLQPLVSGKVDGTAFSDFYDGDAVLSPFLETIIRDRYVLVPFAQVKRFTVSPPKRLRDLLWAPGSLETLNGPAGDVFFPVLYSGSFRHDDDQVKLGRMTDWEDAGEGLQRGMGQRLFFVDDREKSILEIREIEFTADEHNQSS
jgi:type VI secretion system protein ImpE